MDDVITTTYWIHWISGAAMMISCALAGLLGLIFDRDKLHALGVFLIPFGMLGSAYVFYVLNARIIGVSWIIYTVFNTVLFLFAWFWLDELFENRSVEILGICTKLTGVIFFASLGVFYVLS